MVADRCVVQIPDWITFFVHFKSVNSVRSEMCLNLFACIFGRAENFQVPPAAVASLRGEAPVKVLTLESHALDRDSRKRR